MSENSQLDAILAPVKLMAPVEQLKFWRSFRAVHRRHVAKTEAQLCSELFKAVDEQIENLRQYLAQGA